ncbi:MAG: hypothetical protein JSS34_00275 [Proteobacteria bacterium]|nr:hypothetical protein [Pseudomonadota bacterium]
MKLHFVFLIIMGFTAGCSTSEEEPVGIGSDADSLKRSACPCGTLFYQNGFLV